MGQQPNRRDFDRRTYKKCIKCRTWKPKADIFDEDGVLIEKHGFGTHPDADDGLQVICIRCKGAAGSKARDQNPRMRIRHHTATRCLTQLGDLAPDQFVTNIEDYLGYKIAALVRHLGAVLKEDEGPKRKLKDALAEGYHIDHIRPLSSFEVVRDGEVDWEEFRRCWAMENLKAIPADDNLAKGAKWDGE